MLKETKIKTIKNPELPAIDGRVTLLKRQEKIGSKYVLFTISFDRESPDDTSKSPHHEPINGYYNFSYENDGIIEANYVFIKYRKDDYVLMDYTSRDNPIQILLSNRLLAQAEKYFQALANIQQRKIVIIIPVLRNENRQWVIGSGYLPSGSRGKRIETDDCVRPYRDYVKTIKPK